MEADGPPGKRHHTDAKCTSAGPIASRHLAIPRNGADRTEVWFSSFAQELPRPTFRKYVSASIAAKLRQAKGRFVPKAYDFENKALVASDWEFLAEIFVELCQDDDA